MRNYELSALLSAEKAGDNPSAFTQKCTAFLQEHQGEVKKEEILGKRLFYKENKAEDAVLVCVVFSLPPETTHELRTWLKSQPEIFRFLLLEVSLKPRRERPRPVLAEIKPQTEEKKAEMGEIDKKLEEIFKET